MADGEQLRGAGAPVGRRSFVSGAVALFAAVAGCTPFATRSSQGAGNATDDAEGEIGRFRDIPMPTHVPNGYRLTRRLIAPVEGFRAGPNEIAVVYMNPAYDQTHGNGLVLFFAKGAAGEFGMTRGRSGEQLSIGSPFRSAVYHDGAWMPYDGPNPDRIGPHGHGFIWDRTRLNSIVARSANYSIGIRGNRQTGVGRTELIGVLQALAWRSAN